MYSYLSIQYICLLLGFTRQAYYIHKQRLQDTQMQEVLILKEVQRIRKEAGKLGTEKLLFELAPVLKEHNIKYGRDKLYKLLSEHSMLVRQRKTRARTTDSNHPYRKYPNIIKDITLNRSNRLWVSDITYLRTKLGFVYLSLITDAYSKKIVGWCLWPDLTRKGPLNALKMAINTEKPVKRKLIHHSDRGVQYCCTDYVNYLKAEQINISMTENGDPYENAIAERVNGILKQQYDLNQSFNDYFSANEAVKQAVYKYNYKRPHVNFLFQEKLFLMHF